MYIEINPISLIDIISISTAFMLGALFLTARSKNNSANVFLTLFLWSLAGEVLFTLLDGQNIRVPEIATDLLTLPFLLIYIARTINYSFKRYHSILLIPLILEFSGLFPPILYYCFIIVLLVIGIKLIKQNKRQLGEFYSDIQSKTLLWASNILYIYLFFYIFWSIEELIGLESPETTEYFAITSTVLTLGMIYWVGFNGFSQPEVFNIIHLNTASEQPEIQTKKEVNDVQESTLTSSYFLELSDKIRNDKLFLQRELTIRELARQLNLNEKELSKMIKTHTGKNFYHYINHFRLEEYKRLLHTPEAQKLTLLGLSEEAGFTSKSTFYSVFKSVEGMTPKQYLKQLKMNEE